MSGYPTFTSIPWVDGLSKDTPVLGRHTIIHAANLIRLHSTVNQDLSSLQLVLGYQPNISHLRVFGCVVGIYVVLVFMLIFNLHLLLTILSLFTARFAYCHFNEDVFPPLWGESQFQKNGQKLHGLNHLFLILTPHKAI